MHEYGSLKKKQALKPEATAQKLHPLSDMWEDDGVSRDSSLPNLTGL